MSVPLLLRLARELRSRRLPELIGRYVHLESVADVEPCLRALLVRWVPAGARWHECNAEGTLAKYGLIDARFDAPRALLDDPSTQVGLAVLRAAGVIPTPGEPPPETLEGGTCLPDLAAELDQCSLDLYLEDRLPDHGRIERVKAAHLARKPLTPPPGYFPRDLVVTDACVSNAPYLWFLTHFYL